MSEPRLLFADVPTILDAVEEALWRAGGVDFCVFVIVDGNAVAGGHDASAEAGASDASMVYVATLATKAPDCTRWMPLRVLGRTSRSLLRRLEAQGIGFKIGPLPPSGVAENGRRYT